MYQPDGGARPPPDWRSSVVTFPLLTSSEVEEVAGICDAFKGRRKEMFEKY